MTLHSLVSARSRCLQATLFRDGWGVVQDQVILEGKRSYAQRDASLPPKKNEDAFVGFINEHSENFCCDVTDAVRRTATVEFSGSS
jgi:hypothetical protein